MNWSNKVKTKWTPPENLFKSGSAEEIAKSVSKNASEKKAMSRLNFYLNRGGENITPEIKSKVEKAKNIIKGTKNENKSFSDFISQIKE